MIAGMRPAFVALLVMLPALVPEAAVAAPQVPAVAPGASHAYVQGRLALAEENFVLAARRFDQALAGASDPDLRRRALDVAILGGDMRGAARLARQIGVPAESAPDEGIGDSILILLRAADSLQRRDMAGYEAALQALDAPFRLGATSPVVVAIMRAWGEAARGRPDAALAILDGQAPQGIGASYLAEHRAHLLGWSRRWPEASEALGAMVAGEGGNVPRLRIAAAAAMIEAGRGDAQARAKAEALLAAGPAADPLLMEAREALEARPTMEGRRLGGLVERPADGLALLFFRIAADLGRERALGTAVSFARIGTMLGRALPDGWLLTSDLLARSERAELALASLEPVPDRGAWSEMADVRRAFLLARRDRHDEARAILERLAFRPEAQAQDWARLGDFERQRERHAVAASHFGRALAMMPAEQGEAHAQLWFLKGAAHERAGEWPAAEEALRAALKLQPDNAIYLNYLGYSLLDRGLRIDEARALIKRAYAAAPENGAIIDSMGWAEFLVGNYAEAVRLLEQARAAEPADPTVADHLGDALWRTGRRIEARHMWRSAQTLDPDAALTERLAAKLETGLDGPARTAGAAAP